MRLKASPHLKLVNRVDRLLLKTVDVLRLKKFASFNKKMNSFVLRIRFLDCKATLQFFVVSRSAMCFTCNFSSKKFAILFNLLNKKYGVHVDACKLCTSVWTYSLLSKIGDLSKLFHFISSQHPTLQLDFSPELFPCISFVLKKDKLSALTARVFHTGKVVLLGVRCSTQLNCAVEFIEDLFFGFSLSNSFDNFV